MKTIKRTISISLSAICILWLTYSVFGAYLLYSQKMQVNNITIRTSEPISQNAVNITKQVKELFINTDFNAEFEKEDFNIILCNDYFKYSISGLVGKSIAYTQPVTNNIFFAMADLDKNLAYSKIVIEGRSLSSVIAHEITHILMFDKYGFLKMKFAPTWKNEGIAEYISQSSSYNIEKGFYNLANGIDDDCPTFSYFKWRIMVVYLIDIKNYTIDKIIKTDFNEKEVLDSAIKNIELLKEIIM